MENVEHKETYKKWKTLVNMSKGELEKFYNSQEGKDAGLSSQEASEQGISSGRESARWIMKMKDTPVSDWTPSMWRWAKKQISFISRMSGNKGPLYDDKGNKTRKHTSLLIWGNNPESNPDIRYKDGGSIKTYRNKFNIKYGFDNNESHSLAEISKIVNLKLSSLQDIYNKGIGAYKTNPQSVRPNVKSKEQWAMARVYSAVMGGKAAGVDANELERGKKYVEGGRTSNLTPEQQKLVRTPEFKAWFGDWENSPESASKIVDENGEPLVVYHGTKKMFSDFSIQENISNPYLLGNDNGIGFFFTNDIDSAEKYAGIRIIDGEKKIPKNSRVIKSFLNIRSPYNFNFSEYAKFTKQVNDGKLMKGQIEALGYDGIIIEKNYSIIVFYSNQIKLADGSNTAFDGSNPDIRYADGGEVYNTGILRRSLNPRGAIGVIPEDIHTKQGLWQNYGQNDEIDAEIVYGEPDYYGHYLDKYGKEIRDIKTGDQLLDTWEDDGDGDKRVAATISNEQLKNDLIESFKTKDGEIYLSEVIAALPKNSDGSITAYRIGDIGDGIQSYTVSEGMAKTFSNIGTDIMPFGLMTSLPREGYKDFGSLPTNVVKINPEWIVAWSPYDKELLVKSKYVKFSDGGSLNSFQQLANRYNNGK